MTVALRIASGLLGLLLGLSFLNWLLTPAKAAAMLGMPLLEGVGRNSQVGDFTAFFFTLTVLIGLGVWRRQPQPLFCACLLLGSAALFRVLAALLHDATLAPVSVAVEVVGTAVLLAYASRLGPSRSG
ncbi:MAG: hypothetical protein RJQ10_10190 [Haliea sp.]|uniref:hypothetical protein n=1 Tax=Haliea sp. TaxID=1932666 RepID=UPI0032EF3AD3